MTREEVEQWVSDYVAILEYTGWVTRFAFLDQDNPPEAIERGELVYRIWPVDGQPFTMIDTRAVPDDLESQLLPVADGRGDLPDPQHDSPLE